jgi:hypothetical protein
MPDNSSFSVVNLGQLSKPADTLIKKVSYAVEGMFAPWQIKRVAKAEAEASLIKANSEIEITDLHRRAMHRFVEEEAKRQENMERITERALPQLESGADASKMEDDWVTNFFDKSRIVSDSDMQELWSRVLAGEANSPGTYSKRTVNLLGDLDKSDAELFLALCSFGWSIGEFTPLIFKAEDSIYNDKGLNFGTLSHLENIGLVQYNNIVDYKRTHLPKTFIVSYCGRPLTLIMPQEKDNNLSIGRVFFTRVGLELSSVCHAQGVDGFFDYVKNKWKGYLPEDNNTEHGAAADAPTSHD